MPRVFKRRPFPGFGRGQSFPGWGLEIEWPPIATSPQPDVVHEIITNVIEVPAPGDPSDLSQPDMPVITSWGSQALGPYLRACAVAPASATWPTANLAIFYPFYVARAYTVKTLASGNAAAVSGNIDVGVYDVNGTRLVSAGSTAQAGTSTWQEFDVTDTTLAPGVYYMAVALNNTTGTLRTQRPGTTDLRLVGVVQMASAFPLPATATYAAHTVTSGYAGLIGLSSGTSVFA